MLSWEKTAGDVEVVVSGISVETSEGMSTRVVIGSPWRRGRI